jgi:hypothetical protein
MAGLMQEESQADALHTNPKTLADRESLSQTPHTALANDEQATVSNVSATPPKSPSMQPRAGSSTKRRQTSYSSTTSSSEDDPSDYRRPGPKHQQNTPNILFHPPTTEWPNEAPIGSEKPIAASASRRSSLSVHSASQPKAKRYPLSPAPSISPEELAEGDIFPKKIPCTLRISVDGTQVGPTQNQSIKWYKPSEYKVLNKLAKDSVRAKFPPNTEDDEIYIRYGSCRVVGPKHQDHFSRLDSDDTEVLSDNAILNICGFIGAHPYEKVDLEVYWDYSSLSLKGNGSDFGNVIRTEIYRKKKKNFLKQAYLPRNDVGKLAQKPIIQRIVEADDSLTPSEKSPLIEDVLKRAQRMFVVCVARRLPMSFLKHLIDSGYGDRDLPNTSHACKEDCRAMLDEFLSEQPGFFARHIEDYTVETLEDEEVMPIRYANDGDQEGSQIGSGAFSVVYSVTIDPAHHYLPGVSVDDVHARRIVI